MSKAKRKIDKYSDEYEELKSRTKFKRNQLKQKQNKILNRAFKTKDIDAIIQLQESDYADI